MDHTGKDGSLQNGLYEKHKIPSGRGFLAITVASSTELREKVPAQENDLNQVTHISMCQMNCFVCMLFIIITWQILTM